eukprot:m51a1_g5585 putative camp-specific 3 -cyclic phosphodiesterase 4d-like (286) ;mRNA; f:637400-641128
MCEYYPVCRPLRCTSRQVIVDSILSNTAQAGVTELSPVEALETCSYLVSCGALVSVPLLASPIAVVFNNASGLPLNLRISRTALSGIMTGNIGLWNHPTLVADNPALAAVGALPITVVWTRDRNRAAAIEAATSKLGVPGHMAKHVEILGSFNAKVAGTGVGNESADRLMVLVMMMKVADLSNAARPWDTCRMWADRICTEFFNQGDQERKLGLAISPFMDRNAANLPKMQCTFGDVIVKPTLESMQSVIPAVSELLEHVSANRKFWMSMSLQQVNACSAKQQSN